MGIVNRAIQRRDSLGNPSKWLTLAFGGGTDTASGIRVNETVALRNLTIMACVKVISDTIAQLPLPLWRRLPDGGKERVPTHPLYKILDRKPNNDMTSFTFRETLSAHLLTWGNAYAFIERDNAGRVLSLYPLLPDRTRPILRDGRIVYQTRLKRDPNSVSSDDNVQLYFESKDVLHIPGLGFDGLKGYSVISQARESIGLGLSLTEYASRFFGNGAVPGFLLKTDRALSPEQRTLIKTQWEENHQGLTNAQRLAVLENGLSVEKIGIPPEDAQFLQSRQFSRNELASIYRVPPHMIGDIERTTSWGSGIEQQAIGFLVYTILPWAERWQQAINTKLLTDAEQDIFFCEFVVDALLRGDTATRYQAYDLAFGKWMTPDDIRQRENFPKWGAKAGGDLKIVPSGAVPVIDGVPTVPQPLAGPDSSENQPSAASFVPFEVRESRQKLASAFETSFADIADRILRREKADLTRGKLTDQAVDEFYAERGYVERQMLPQLQTYAESVRMLVENELGRPVPTTKRFSEFVRNYSVAFAKRHNEESRALVADRSAPALERAFGPSVRRAERIATHEASQAGNAFAKALYREAGVTTYRWLLGDEREDCRAQSLAVLSDATKFTHPPLGDGCGCVLASAEVRSDRPAEPQVDPMVRALTALAAPQPVHVSIEKGAIQSDVYVGDDGAKQKALVDGLRADHEKAIEELRSDALSAAREAEMKPEQVIAMIESFQAQSRLDREAFVGAIREFNIRPEQVAPVINVNFPKDAIRVEPSPVTINMPDPSALETEILYDKHNKVVGSRKVKK